MMGAGVTATIVFTGGPWAWAGAGLAAAAPDISVSFTGRSPLPSSSRNASPRSEASSSPLVTDPLAESAL